MFPNEVAGRRSPPSDLDDSDFLPMGRASVELALEWSKERASPSSPAVMRLPANRRSSSAGSLDLPNVPNLDFLFSAFLLLSMDCLPSIEGRADAVSTTTGPLACFWRVNGWNLLDFVRCKVGFSVTSEVGAVIMIAGAAV